MTTMTTHLRMETQMTGIYHTTPRYSNRYAPYLHGGPDFFSLSPCPQFICPESLIGNPYVPDPYFPDPYVHNPYVRTPYVRNPYVPNPYAPSPHYPSPNNPNPDYYGAYDPHNPHEDDHFRMPPPPGFGLSRPGVPKPRGSTSVRGQREM